MIRVLLPSQLESYTGGLRKLDADGATVDEVLRDVDARFPGLRFRVIDEQDRVRRHMKLFLRGEPETAISAPTRDGDELLIVGALSGG